MLQHVDGSANARIDHRREGGVEDRVGRDELAPLGPRLVEVGEVVEAGGIGLAFGPARVGAERLETSIEDAAVPEVVEAHGGGRDVSLERGSPRRPLRVPQAEHLLVVGEAEDEVR